MGWEKKGEKKEKKKGLELLGLFVCLFVGANKC